MTLDLNEILPLVYKHTQGKMEGESSSLSEVTWGFLQGTPTIYGLLFVLETVFSFLPDCRQWRSCDR